LAALLFLLAGAPACAGRDPQDPQSAPPPPRAAERQATRPMPADLNAPPPREANPDDALCAPLLIEPDLGFGTSVVMRRLPTAGAGEHFIFLSALHPLVLALPEWPATSAEPKPLQQAILPEGAEIVVLLPGWPPTHEALDAWNLVGGALRLIVIVDGPPAD